MMCCREYPPEIYSLDKPWYTALDLLSRKSLDAKTGRGLATFMGCLLEDKGKMYSNLGLAGPECVKETSKNLMKRLEQLESSKGSKSAAREQLRQVTRERAKEQKTLQSMLGVSYCEVS